MFSIHQQAGGGKEPFSGSYASLCSSAKVGASPASKAFCSSDFLLPSKMIVHCEDAFIILTGVSGCGDTGYIHFKVWIFDQDFVPCFGSINAFHLEV